jgi:hypothetical protein
MAGLLEAAVLKQFHKKGHFSFFIGCFDPIIRLTLVVSS